MKKLFSTLILLSAVSLLAQVPPFLRHGFTTNIPNANQFTLNAIKDGARTTNNAHYGTTTENGSVIVLGTVTTPALTLDGQADYILSIDGSGVVGPVTIGSGLSYDTGTATLSATGGSGTTNFIPNLNGKGTNTAIYSTLTSANVASLTVPYVPGQTSELFIVGPGVNSGQGFDILTNGTTLVRAPANASLPAFGVYGNQLITQTGTTNDALYISATNSLPSFVVKSSGNVGVGTATPLNPFQVYVAANQNLAVRTAGGRPELFAATDNGGAYVPLGINGSSLLLNYGSGAGNVGIGTTSPTAKLEVAGTQDSYLFRVNTNVFFISNGVVWASADYKFVTDNANDIGASSANRPRIIFAATGINNGGYYIAGGGSPIYWSGRSVLRSPSDGVVSLYNQAETDFNRLQLGGTNAAFPAIGRTNGMVRILSAAQSVGDSTVSTNGLVVDGSVGIGTTSPAYKLHVAGDGYYPTNAAPFRTVNGTSVLITNVNQRATLELKLYWSGNLGARASCSIISTNLVSTNIWDDIMPMDFTSAAGAVTNWMSFRIQTNAVTYLSDTSGAGAISGIVSWKLREE